MVGDINGLDDIWSRYLVTLDCPYCDSDQMTIRWAAHNHVDRDTTYYWRYTCGECGKIWYDPNKGPKKTYLPKSQ